MKSDKDIREQLFRDCARTSPDHPGDLAYSFSRFPHSLDPPPLALIYMCVSHTF
jgi:hypothetical protein